MKNWIMVSDLRPVLRPLASKLPGVKSPTGTLHSIMGVQILSDRTPEDLAGKTTGTTSVALPRPLEIFLGVAGAVPVRFKIMGMVLGIVLLLGLSMLMSMRSSLVTELETLPATQTAHVTDLVSRAVIIATIGTALIGIAAATVLTY